MQHGSPVTLATGKISATSAGYTFWRRKPTAHSRPRSLSACRNRPLDPYPARQAHSRNVRPARRHDRSPQLRSLVCQGNLALFGNLRPSHPRRVTCPTIRQERAQPNYDWHFSGSQRRRDQRLTVGGPASAEAYCGPTPTEWVHFFGKAVSSMNRNPASSPTSRSASFHQCLLYRSAVPNPRCDKMMKLTIADFACQRCYRLNALTVSCSYQTCYVGRVHPAPRLVSKRAQKRLKPTLQMLFPVRTHRQLFR